MVRRRTRFARLLLTTEIRKSLATLEQMAMEAFQQAASRATGAIAEALKGVFPAGFHAKFQVVVDNGMVNPGNITVEWRARQQSTSPPRSNRV